MAFNQPYDLSTDPFKNHNLAEQYPEVTARLHKANKELKADVKKTHAQGANNTTKQDFHETKTT